MCNLVLVFSSSLVSIAREKVYLVNELTDYTLR
jgi:hypothetical protein